ncbi:Fic family protein [Anaerolineales bacterium HSG25]|nr:Fic family protein [Anaerolineales bacterium HSG25]
MGYQLMASAVFSANIEGNSIDLNSFMNMRLAQIKFKPTKEVAEIEDLISAYQFAQTHSLTEKTMLQAHALLAKNLVEPFQQGAYRQTKSGVFSPRGLVYLAVEPEFVTQEMARFFVEINQLLTMSLSLSETFYFAALIHLRFVHIHPFIDGNGRTARLLEKWVMAHHLGDTAWQIPTEQYYKEHQRSRE